MSSCSLRMSSLKSSTSSSRSSGSIGGGSVRTRLCTARLILKASGKMLDVGARTLRWAQTALFVALIATRVSDYFDSAGPLSYPRLAASTAGNGAQA